MFRGGRGGARYDNFRARTQNTSRPPSMHVDDFVAMESGRGRGRGRGGQSTLNDRSAARPSIRKVGEEQKKREGEAIRHTLDSNSCSTCTSICGQ
jgi:hypothetical protein